MTLAKNNRKRLKTGKLEKQNEALLQQLREAKETIEQIKKGKVDALVARDKKGIKIYTEKTADKAFRILIEKMPEGAVTLNKAGTILYSNSYFSNILNLPLQKVLGTKFKTFIDNSSKKKFDTIFKQGWKRHSKDEIHINTIDGKTISVLLSVTAVKLNNMRILTIIITDLTIPNKSREELKLRTRQLEKKNIELEDANIELAYQYREKEKRAQELKIANNKVAIENAKKAKLAKELIIANKKLNIENEKKAKLAKELIIANKKLNIENEKKAKLAKELIIANKKLNIENEKKAKLAKELIIANKKLNIENEKKAKLAKELIIANKKLNIENEKKAKLAKELIIANKKLNIENEKKAKLAKELIIASKKLNIENEKKAKLAGELIIANKELSFQNKEKEKRAAELAIATIKLKENEKQFRLIVENVKDYAILLLDANGYIKTWNKGAERIKGYSAEEIIGKNISVMYTPEELLNKEPERNLRMAKQEGRYESEGWRVRKDGSQFFADVIITALYDENNNFQGFSKITRDITQRRKNESDIKEKSEELIKINTELSNANKDLTTFTYVSSHDLQEPLRKIKNFISVLLKEEEKNLSVSGKKYLHRTYEVARRMQMLIEDLLTYSRAKNPERKFEKISLDTIIEEVKKEFEETLREKKATIKTGNLCEVTIIPFQFRQVFQNLVSNSLKFTKPLTAPRITIESELVKGSKLTIEKLSRKINYCHIIYTDNGIGFEPLYNERIFEVFQRLHSKEEFEGTGMGLAICKRIIENHNGIITATGELNKGARFDIYLPAGQAGIPAS